MNMMKNGIGGILSSYNDNGMRNYLKSRCKADSYDFSSATVFEKSKIYGVKKNDDNIEIYNDDDKAAFPNPAGPETYSRTRIYMWRSGTDIYVGCVTAWNNSSSIWHKVRGAIYHKKLKSSPSNSMTLCSEIFDNVTGTHENDVKDIAMETAGDGEEISNIKISGSWSDGSGNYDKGTKSVTCNVKKGNDTYVRKIRFEFDNIYDLIWYAYKDGESEEDAQNNLDEQLKRNYNKITAGDTGTERGPTAYNDVLEDVNVYDPGNVTETGGVLDIGSKILGGINIVGVVASVIILAVLGLKFIMGSVEEKAEIKESLVPYVIGIVLFVGITTIVNILYNFGQSLK